MTPVTYSVVGPDGVRHEGRNLRSFCRDHGLDEANMRCVIDGARRHHKGYTCPEAGYRRTYVRSK
jgi:hypothetical protein